MKLVIDIPKELFKTLDYELPIPTIIDEPPKLMSREEVILHRLIGIIKDGKHYQENNSWIPVSNQKPQDEQRVLITRKGKTYIGYRDRKSWTSEKVYEWTIEGDLYTYDDNEIDAWMPLPKSYEVND